MNPQIRALFDMFVVRGQQPEEARYTLLKQGWSREDIDKELETYHQQNGTTPHVGSQTRPNAHISILPPKEKQSTQPPVRVMRRIAYKQNIGFILVSSLILLILGGAYVYAHYINPFFGKTHTYIVEQAVLNFVQDIAEEESFAVTSRLSVDYKNPNFDTGETVHYVYEIPVTSYFGMLGTAQEETGALLVNGVRVDSINFSSIHNLSEVEQERVSVDLIRTFFANGKALFHHEQIHDMKRYSYVYDIQDLYHVMRSVYGNLPITILEAENMQEIQGVVEISILINKDLELKGIDFEIKVLKHSEDVHTFIYSSILDKRDSVPLQYNSRVPSLNQLITQFSQETKK